MSTIIVPTDFSATAENALQFALGFAQHYNFSITLFHAVSPSAVGLVNSVHAVDNGEQLLNDATEHLKKIQTRLQESHAAIPVETAAQIGYIMDTLSDFATQLNPVAIIMGVTGSGSTMDKLMGSNAIHIMNHTKFPTVIVPKKAEFKPIQSLAFACDLKQVASSTPTVSIRAFAKLFDAEVKILNVDYHNRHYSPQTPEEVKHLEAMLQDTKHSYHFVEDESTSHAISSFISENKIDMLIMLPKKHHFWDQLMHKSQTEEMAYHTHIPILALHAE